MPVLWEFQDDVVVLRFVGETTMEEREHVRRELPSDPQLRPGLKVLSDVRSAIIAPMATEEFQRRVEWLVSLTGLGLAPRFATVMRPEHELFVRRGTQMIGGRLLLRAFTDLARALRWLRAPLSLRPTMWIADDPQATAENPKPTPVQYEVVGLPPGDDARIELVDLRWKVRRGGRAWEGDYETEHAALAGLEIGRH